MWDNNNYTINKKRPNSQSDPEYKKEFSFSQLISEVQVFLLLSRKPLTEITDIINLSLIHGLCTNYRPISVPAASSKIFEKYVLVELMFHILSMMYLRPINPIF